MPETNQIQKDVTIIGAGITGLTLAYYLKKKNVNVAVVENADKIGGVIHTLKKNGFTFETGPNTGVLSNPELAELFEELDLVELETANEDSKKRWIMKNNKFRAIPSGLIGGIRTPLFTFKDKIRILGEPWRKTGTDPNESLASLVRRRMGKSFLDYAVDPFISGIYAGDPEKIIPKYALPKLYNLEQEYGSFIKGAIKKKKEPKTERDLKATKEVFSAKDGLEHLVKALGVSISEENIYLNCSNDKIESLERGFKTTFSQNNETFEIISQKVITTIPSFELPNLLPFISSDKLEPITALEYAKVVQLVLGYNNWKGIKLDAFGGLIPKLENKKILGILFPSSIFENRAPKDGALLSVFMGGMRHPEVIDLKDEQILDIAVEEVKNTLKETQDPDLHHVFRYMHAIPQYTITSPERLSAIETIEQKYPGLILAGNIRDGIGMADRVKQASEISKNIIV
ncbi:MAG: protoporphyrinogen oxidase [Salinivirgaceae bacterium]|nr:MAG: protoporphyrinogen oxidase [Salinivirgaceae bacterium]